MEIKRMKLADLVIPEKNIRIHTEQQLKEFERSVRMFGQIRPIVIDENKVILAGNGLYVTLLRMGETEADVYQYFALTENQKKKLMIADNKIFALGIENLNTLNDFLDELHDDLDIPGYDSEILKQMVSEAEDITEKISEYGILDDYEVKEIKERNERQAIESLKPVFDSNNNVNQPMAPIGTTSEPIQEEQDEQTADIRKFVICPRCGEKIWL